MWPLNLEYYEVVKSNGKKIYNQPVDLSFLRKKNSRSNGILSKNGIFVMNVSDLTYKF